MVSTSIIIMITIIIISRPICNSVSPGRALNDEEIVGLLLAALFAGQHTSNITSTWLGLHLFQKQDTLMPRLEAEVSGVMKKYNGTWRECLCHV
jgi:cytochrome P450